MPAVNMKCYLNSRPRHDQSPMARKIQAGEIMSNQIMEEKKSEAAKKTKPNYANRFVVTKFERKTKKFVCSFCSVDVIHLFFFLILFFCWFIVVFFSQMAANMLYLVLKRKQQMRKWNDILRQWQSRWQTYSHFSSSLVIQFVLLELAGLLACGYRTSSY